MRNDLLAYKRVGILLLKPKIEKRTQSILDL